MPQLRRLDGGIPSYATVPIQLSAQSTFNGGTPLATYYYDSFGNIVTETNARNGDRFKFAGMQYDAATGQCYDHARDYNSATGCFTGQDPRNFAAGDSNLYRYVKNEPTSAVDPDGEMVQGSPNSNASGGMSAPESDHWVGRPPAAACPAGDRRDPLNALTITESGISRGATVRVFFT